ncbi:unnamed protein product [Penicillium salamii]|uniref:Signal peptidase complex catalytic subunit SEC11 n=1 Tax=Penicillium salamii TaxID=1612424 RepID=A0A9W4N1Q3_9EURO|nr:unnamed protein product [Penicillium salamii]CAG8080920.1 unnamed protein product [Penicillium salamii]CAG8224788.1 unnamed protein product [Penicillium salamii]CAG8269388.1 unnamed protein product [Penicillium salamii]CAG8374853.1 unnamed protein product [Penicillium salamii]
MKRPWRLLFSQIFAIVWAVASVFLGWGTLCIVTGSKYPILVVTSESMEPAFQRGDLIFLWNREKIIHTGDIPVIWIPGKPLPMVHRVITVNHEVQIDGHLKYMILTKGDNNAIDDRFMYLPGRPFALREEVFGLVWGYVPKVGWASLVLQGGFWR